jgi:Protein of unknown function (DUF2975)
MMNTTHSARLDKARQLSRGCRLICRLLLAAATLLRIAIAIPMGMSLSASTPTWRAYTLSTDVIGVLSVVYWAAGIWVLERLFNVFVTGRVFDPSSGFWLKRFGFWVATVQLLPFAARATLDMAVFGRLGAVSNTPYTPIIDCLLLGLFLIMLGWVLEEGSDLQAEQDLTV